MTILAKGVAKLKRGLARVVHGKSIEESRFVNTDLAGLYESAIHLFRERKYSEHKAYLKSELDKILLPASISLLECNPDEKRIRDVVDKVAVCQLKDLVYYFQLYGDLVTACRIRNCYRQRLMAEQEELDNISINALKAVLEAGQPEFVLDMIRKKNGIPGSRRVIDELKAHAYLLLHEFDKSKQIKDKIVENDDTRMKELFEGATVAVVGPAASTTETKAEAETFSQIVATNVLCNNRFLESRKLISYYNYAALQEYSSEIGETLARLSVAVFKSKRAADAIRDANAQDRHGCVIRVMHSAHTIMLNDYGPNAIQNIVYDLMWYNPGIIKLFAVDFFTSQKRQFYNVDYSLIPDEIVTSKSLRIHDPFSNFNLVKNLYMAGLVKADDTAGTILNKTEEQYAVIINKLHGENTVDS